MKSKLIHVLLFVCLLGGSAASLLARGFSGNCSGTYLIDEDGGATALWTFEADGTFFATSSLQPRASREAAEPPSRQTKSRTWMSFDFIWFSFSEGIGWTLDWTRPVRRYRSYSGTTKSLRSLVETGPKRNRLLPSPLGGAGGEGPEDQADLSR